MSGAGSRSGGAPPQVDLDDYGFRWRQVGDTLVMSRGLTPRAVLWPIIGALTTLGIGSRMVIEGDWWLGGFMLGATILPGALIWIRLVHRFRLELSPDGLTWQQTKPRAFHGQWPGREVNGVRLVVGAAMSGWFRNRWILVDVRRGGAWVRLAAGLHRRRGERLARAISETRAWPLVLHDEDRDGPLPH